MIIFTQNFLEYAIIKTEHRNFEYIPIYLILYSLDDGRIRLNTTNPNVCRVTFANAKPSDSGTWSIQTLLCSRGRGKSHDKATVYVEKGREINVLQIETRILIKFVYNHMISKLEPFKCT